MHCTVSKFEAKLSIEHKAKQIVSQKRKGNVGKLSDTLFLQFMS